MTRHMSCCDAGNSWAWAAGQLLRCQQFFPSLEKCCPQCRWTHPECYLPRRMQPADPSGNLAFLKASVDVSAVKRRLAGYDIVY